MMLNACLLRISCVTIILADTQLSLSNQKVKLSTFCSLLVPIFLTFSDIPKTFSDYYRVGAKLPTLRDHLEIRKGLFCLWSPCSVKPLVLISFSNLMHLSWSHECIFQIFYCSILIGIPHKITFIFDNRIRPGCPMLFSK